MPQRWTKQDTIRPGQNNNGYGYTPARVPLGSTQVGVTGGPNAPTITALQTSYTVGALPAAASFPFLTTFVTDATQTLAAGLGTNVAGSGANIVPVYSDGSNWIIG